MAEKEYIARISYGKDSLKMLEVIRSRGLPLDRITTTDVWATDTISANLPPMAAFKERMDQRIWDMYRIQVEHLCARNKDGSKRTYEQMFYHVPVRKSGGGTSKEQSEDSRISGIRGVKLDSSGMPMHRVQGTFTGFPPNSKYSWCQKLKIRFLGQDQVMASVKQETAMVPTSQIKGQNTLFRLPAPTGQKKYRGLLRHSCRRGRQIRPAQRQKACSAGRVWY